jgi:hypothetical protein
MMLSASASEIGHGAGLSDAVCPAVFTAEHAVLADSLTTILGIEINTDAWPASNKNWPFDYAYVLVDVSCGPEHKVVRLLSQTFAFCGPDMTEAQVLSDNDAFIRQVMNVSCPVPRRIISQYIVRESTPARAEQSRARASRDSTVRVVPWTAAASAYVRTCK